MNCERICRITAFSLLAACLLSSCGSSRNNASSSANPSAETEISESQDSSSPTDAMTSHGDDTTTSIGVKKVEVNKERHLILTLNDNSTKDYGYIGGEDSDGSYAVCFVDYNNRVLKVELATPDGQVTPPTTPSREGYDFVGWDGSYTNVKSDTVLTATYVPKQQDDASYTVTFKDFDGSVLKTETVDAGNSATPPENPTRDGYLFAGWDGNYSTILGETVITAQYEDANDDARFVVVGATAKRGETVAVQIELDNNPGLTSTAMNISFDKDLTLTKFEVNDSTFPGQFVGPQNVPATDQIKLVWADGTAEIAESGKFATLYFEVSDTAALGAHMVVLNYDPEDVFNLDGDNVSFKIINGSVLVEE